MKEQNDCQNLINYLRSILPMLELDAQSQVSKDVSSLCNYLENSIFRIAVFGSFNHGKSTLLNALLGQKTLPIDLIPTTGAAIYVKYGEELKTTITLKNGKKVTELGTKILQEYAILDGDRRMRDDVDKVEVYCHHPFLKMGVELLDLPGTNDREAQDDLVKDKLLTADLIIHVLDARQLMTLLEREKIRDWLQDRGINTVIFVVNFLNLLELEEQKEIQKRLRFVAESFRSDLPNNVSNLYRLDALPALRARLKGDTAAAQNTGLASLESALQTIVQSQINNQKIRLPRIQTIAEKVLQIGTEKSKAIATEIEANEQKEQNKIEINQKAEKLIKQGLQKSISDWETWLYLPNLLSRYQAELVLALQEDTFTSWQAGEFSQTVTKYQQEIIGWVDKGCEFFTKKNTDKLLITFPQTPVINIEPPQQNSPNNNKENTDFTSVAIPSGIGWVLGGPVGAAVLGGASYVLNKVASSEQEVKNPVSSPTKLDDRVYTDAAKEYLTCFSDRAFATLKEYQVNAETLITFEPSKIDRSTTASKYQLQLLNNLLDNIKQEIKTI